MSHTPFAHSESLRVGTVDFVSPDEIKVLLDIEAPDTVALNAGGARPFPRVHSYLLIPVDEAYLVGQVEWLTIERSPFPKRRGVRDFGVVDLPYPLRKLSLNPLGTLRKRPGRDKTEEYVFRRGADAFPSVGVSVLLPTEKQLRSIVESGARRRVRIGTSPLANDAEVRIDPDRLFGRHLAVLGNTGSGKSCSVVGMIRWSLDAAKSEREDDTPPNARFIILDPNGEYSRAFGSSASTWKARLFKVKPEEETQLPLQVPLWFWNSAEWISFTQASTKTQKPALLQALRFARDGGTTPAESPTHEIRRFLRTIVHTIRVEKHSGTPWGQFPKPKAFLEKLEKWQRSLEVLCQSLSGDVAAKITNLTDYIEALAEARRVQYAHYDFELTEVEGILTAAQEAHSAAGGLESELAPVDADSPLPFAGDALVQSLEATAELMNVSEYVETLLIRLRSLLGDSLMVSIIGPEQATLSDWLTQYVGTDAEEPLTILDLSLVPTEIVHIITAVTARMIFESLQRYRKITGKTLPTVLVMEEAHTFVKRYKDDVENYEAAVICCQVFERIAREGRKFGLGLVLSSQRPSELSPTVLSQCNTFLLHRISNDRDQELVHRLVPDNLRGLLRELPSLPSQHGVLLGWASELPLLVRIDDLPKEQQPHSDDPDFWDVWTGRDAEGKEVERKVEWQVIADDWQGEGKKSS